MAQEIHRVLHNLILKHGNQFPLIMCGDMNSVTLPEHRGPEPHFCDYDRHNSDIVLLPEANNFSDAHETRFPNHGHCTRAGPATTTAQPSTSYLDRFFLNEAAQQLAPRDSIRNGVAHNASCYGTDHRCVFLSVPTLHTAKEQPPKGRLSGSFAIITPSPTRWKYKEEEIPSYRKELSRKEIRQPPQQTIKQWN